MYRLTIAAVWDYQGRLRIPYNSLGQSAPHQGLKCDWFFSFDGAATSLLLWLQIMTNEVDTTIMYRREGRNVICRVCKDLEEAFHMAGTTHQAQPTLRGSTALPSLPILEISASWAFTKLALDLWFAQLCSSLAHTAIVRGWDLCSNTHLSTCSSVTCTQKVILKPIQWHYFTPSNLKMICLQTPYGTNSEHWSLGLDILSLKMKHLSHKLSPRKKELVLQRQRAAGSSCWPYKFALLFSSHRRRLSGHHTREFSCFHAIYCFRVIASTLLE